RYVTSTSNKPVPSPTLQRHGLKESELESLDTLRGLYSSDKTWIIDFEFINLIAVKSAVPFTVSIRTVQGQGLLDAVIDYHGASLDDMWEAISPWITYTPEDAEQLRWLYQYFLSSFWKNYQRGNTYGSS
ncbi:hypothetical protein LTR04_003232, partial [Oleoguttula sp. CCFEE 6159]